MSNNFLSDLKLFLVNNIRGAKIVSGGREVVCRCPFCLDSRDPKSAHFYIGVDESRNSTPLYNCKKCNESGVFSSKTLRMFDIYDADISSSLNKFNEKSASRNINRTIKDTGVHYIHNDFISNNDISIYKLQYINNRLGTNMTMQDVIDKKIVLNLYDLLNRNHIQTLTRKEYVTDILDKEFLGFMSYDNGFLNMRNTSKIALPEPLNKRYINYNIFNDVNNSRRYYILPNKIDIIDPRPIQIHMAEGPFDVLGIYYNVMNQDNNRKIYASIGGKSYISLVKFFIQELGLMNIELHIYVDGDIDDFEVNKIIVYLSGLNMDVFIHRNTFAGEKDYGIIKERIIDTKIQYKKRR